MITKSRHVITKTNTVGAAALTLVAFGFSAADVAVADRVIISVTVGAIRLTWDDVANPPTVSFGLKVPTNNYPFFVLEGRVSTGNLQMIRDNVTDSTGVIIVLECE